MNIAPEALANGEKEEVSPLLREAADAPNVSRAAVLRELGPA